MPSSWMIPPAFILILGGLVLPLIPRSLRSIAFLIFPLSALVVLWTLPAGTDISISFTNYTMILCYVDQLSRVFGAIFAIIAFCGGVYSYHIKDLGQQIAALFYAASALGVAFAGDYLTLFVFWELLAITSTYLIWARRTKEAERAGMRYILVHLFGGTLLLAGILLHLSESGSLLITRFEENSSLASWLILGGVALNAAIPPLHAWLSDSYPKATVTGAVFMSAFTTKAAVYVLVRVFPGWEILLIFGVMMAVYGVVFAVLANDIREILAYHIISQVGYMVAGVGIGTAMALNGTTAHAFSHILYKALLFMAAGVVLETTSRSKLTELGGLARAMPLTVVLYMVGAFSISGFPLFNGFISKSMVVSAAGEAHYNTAMLFLHLASVGTFLSIGLKLPYLTWFSQASGVTPTAPPRTMHVGMGIVAFMCILFGIAPSLLYRYLPFTVDYEPYTIPHLVETTQILVFTFVAFWIYRSKLASEPTITLDTDWIYRGPLRRVGYSTVAMVVGAFDATEVVALRVVRRLANWFRNPAEGVRRLIPASPSTSPVDDFDPNRERLGMEYVIALVLACFVVLLTLSLFV